MAFERHSATVQRSSRPIRLMAQSIKGRHLLIRLTASVNIDAVWLAGRRAGSNSNILEP